MAFFAMLFAAGCSHGATSSTAARGEPTVVLLGQGGGELRVKVELARTDQERQRGLMFRQYLAPGTGMLFLWSHPEKLKFWMRNTYIPLDMIFLNQDKRVIYVEENAEPLTQNSRGPDEDSQYVLEVPGGWARQHGVGPGVVARFENVTE